MGATWLPYHTLERNPDQHGPCKTGQPAGRASCDHACQCTDTKACLQEVPKSLFACFLFPVRAERELLAVRQGLATLVKLVIAPQGNDQHFPVKGRWIMETNSGRLKPHIALPCKLLLQLLRDVDPVAVPCRPEPCSGDLSTWTSKLHCSAKLARPLL